MKDLMHIHLAETALDWLSGDCAAFWQPLRKFIKQASNYPDYFTIIDDKNSLIDPAWREYTLIPNIQDIVAHAIYKPLQLRATYPAVIEHWIMQTIANIRSGDSERAAKFVGCLSHLIGDTGQVAHTFDERPLNRLLPQGEKCFTWHPTMEDFMGKIATQKYKPNILAADIEELNWQLIEKLELLKQYNATEIIPILRAIMTGDNEAAEASATRSVTSCAKLFADLLASIWNIATGQAVKLNDALDLQELAPTEQACDMLFNYAIIWDRIPGKTIDAPVRLNFGKEDIHGIALLADMAPFFKETRRAFVEYSIPHNVFKYFEAEIGLNHHALNETKAVFKVKLDGETVFSSAPIGKDNSSIKIKIELGSARRLQLYVRDIRPAPCGTKFFYPVFAEPKLTGRRQKE